MRVMLERLEFTWWSVHIHMLDEVEFIRRLLPSLHQLWEEREEVVFNLVWAALGFPLGLALGYLAGFVQ